VSCHAEIVWLGVLSAKNALPSVHWWALDKDYFNFFKNFFVECPWRALDKVSLHRVSPLTLDKVYLFFSFSYQTFYGVFVQYIDLHVQFSHNYQSVCYNY
jgi:hypothetical protein